MEKQEQTYLSKIEELNQQNDSIYIEMEDIAGQIEDYKQRNKVLQAVN
jgi:FtsZ-binding cell division protein ZapB